MDICYPVLLYQIFRGKGYDVLVWSRSAEIHFLKKIADKLIFSINLSAEDIQQAEIHLAEKGRVTTTYLINIYNSKGEVCVSMKCEVYTRNRRFTKTNCEESLHE